MKLKIWLIFCALFCCESKFTQENKIVIVNVGLGNRIRIAKEVEMINSLNPKVVAFDIIFSEEKDEYQDSLLNSALSQCENLVMSCVIKDFDGLRDSYDSIEGSDHFFLPKSSRGFINALLDDDLVGTFSNFSISETVDSRTIYHFAVQTAFNYDSLRTSAFINSHSKVTKVNYQRTKDEFRVYSDDDVLGGKISRSEIEGKIVLFAYCGPYQGYDGRKDLDKFYTPLNDGTGIPDMYGGIILANIVAQIIE